MLSVTGEDVDLSNIDYANVKHVGIDPGTSVSNANVPEDVTVDNFGAINGGTFAGEVRLLDTGTISGTGTINAGDFTQATFSNFTGTINCGTFGGYTIADGTLTITAPIEVTDDMLAGISTVNVTATGEITGGTLNGDASMETMTVDACGVISGGTFSGKMVVHNRRRDRRRHVQWYRMELCDHQRRHIQRVHRESRRGGASFAARAQAASRSTAGSATILVFLRRSSSPASLARMHP